MDENSLSHYGILGMKWGRRKQKKSSNKTSRREAKKLAKEAKKRGIATEVKKTKKVKIKDLSNEELQSKIRRLQMEKQYRDLKKDEISAGRKLVGDILQTAGKTVGVQVATYTAGKIINKAMKDDVVRVGGNKTKDKKKAA